MRKKIPSLLFLIFLLIILFLSLTLVKKIQNYLGKASFNAANIIIDANVSLGVVNPLWQALAQGGEYDFEDNQPVRFSNAISDLNILSPKYIRIDHIYDFYQVVSKNNGSLSYDFSKLDNVINDILKTGAKPFLCLSYMPPVIAKNGDILNYPESWSDWENVVKTTIEYYSGRNKKNLTDVYYEIWNEPDLFGNFRIGGQKDYRLIYHYASLGAQKAQNVNPFKIGGPATTNPMRTWTVDFLNYISQNNLRIDFISWHRYSFNPWQFKQDSVNVNNWLASFPQYQNIQKIITEWGSDSENNPIHDGYFDAIHTLASIRQMADDINFAFAFEIIDGLSPQKEKYWGRWGLFTNPKVGLAKKPRFYSLGFLNNLSGEKLKIEGEGSDVTAIASKNKDNYQVLLVNFPFSRGGKQIAVPLKIINLPRGIYQVTEKNFLGKDFHYEEKIGGIFEKTINLPINQAKIINLKKIGELATFDNGKFGYPNDQALVLNKENPALIFNLEKNLNRGTIEFWLKNNFEGPALKDQFFLDIPLENNFNLSCKKEISGFGAVIKCGLVKNGVFQDYLSWDISLWRKNEWHFLAISFIFNNQTIDLKFFLDGKENQKSLFLSSPLESTSFLKTIIVGGFDGSLEELRISDIERSPLNYYVTPLNFDQNTLILKHFDGVL